MFILVRNSALLCLPKGEASIVLKVYNGNGFVFLCHGTLKFNISLMEVPETLIVNNPFHDGCPFSEYHAEVIF